MSLTRTIFALTLTITLASSQLAGCGDDGPGACDTYKTAQDACETTYANATGATPQSTETCGGHSGPMDDMFRCMAAAYHSADCSTEDGKTAADDAALDCILGGGGTGGTGTGGTGTGGTGTGGTGTGGTGTGGTGTGGGDNPDAGQISLATVNDASVRLSTCMHGPVNETRDNNLFVLYMEDVGTWGGFVSTAKEMLSCVGAAGSCEAVLACAGLDTGQTCNPTSQPDSCDGSIQSRCFVVDGCAETAVGWTQRLDCVDSPQAGFGDNTQCLMDDESSPDCGAGTCTEGEPSRCEGDVVVECNWNGVLEHRDCSLLGETCVPPIVETGDDGSLSTIGASCTTNTLPTCEDSYCDGDTMVLCMGGFELVQMNCGELAPGLTCSLTTLFDTSYAECGVAETDAECLDGEVSCAGTEARWCIGGKWASVDCGTFLDGTCAIEGAGDSQQVICSSPTWNATVDALDGQAGNAWSCAGVGSGSPSGSGDDLCSAVSGLVEQCFTEYEVSADREVPESLPLLSCDDYMGTEEEDENLNCLLGVFIDADCSTTEALWATVGQSMNCSDEAEGDEG